MLNKGIAYYLIIGFFCFYAHFVSAQDRKKADSLINEYNSGLYQTNKLELLREIANIETIPKIKLQYSELLIKEASVDSIFEFLYGGHYQKGNALREMGNYPKALVAFFKSLNYANRYNNEAGVGLVTMSLADVYSEMGNSKNAEIYYHKSIEMIRKTNDSVNLATALINAGDEAFNNKKYDLALQYFDESGIIFNNVDLKIGKAYNKGNIGMVYAEQGKNELAKLYISEAIAILEELEDYYAISEYLTYMSDIYLNQNDVTTALSYANRSLELAKKNNLKKQLSESNLLLSRIYERKGLASESLKYFKEHVRYRDIIKNIESVEKIADLRTDFEVSQKQTEVNLLEKNAEILELKEVKQRNIIYATAGALFLIALLAFGLLRRNKFIQKTKQIIEEEKNRSDNLLLNILPEETAQELKEFGKVAAKKFESVTVLFADFKGFTRYAENLTPEALVESIGLYFSKFDAIIDKYGLEKIKTIGDAYMCAGGLPFPTEDHAYKMVSAAIEIAEFVEKTKKNEKAIDLNFDIRIGINSGPVVAGVVGIKKFAYDIWGDTVNIASRMESNSEPGKINISENTYQLIKDKFQCNYRGEVDVKNKGMMKMYFVARKFAATGIENKKAV